MFLPVRGWATSCCESCCTRWFKWFRWIPRDRKKRIEKTVETISILCFLHWRAILWVDWKFKLMIHEREIWKIKKNKFGCAAMMWCYVQRGNAQEGKNVGAVDVVELYNEFDYGKAFFIQFVMCGEAKTWTGVFWGRMTWAVHVEEEAIYRCAKRWCGGKQVNKIQNNKLN